MAKALGGDTAEPNFDLLASFFFSFITVLKDEKIPYLASMQHFTVTLGNCRQEYSGGQLCC